MKFFNDCTTLEDVKKLYRNLAKQFHPDKGGDLATMQAINNEYAYAIRVIAKGGNFTAQEIETEILKAEAYQEAVNKVVNLEGCNLELVGSWLWITGNTKPHAGILKSNPARFVWAKKKSDFSAWFFRTDAHKTFNNRQRLTLDQIRTKYGTHTISKSYSNLLTA